MLNKFGKQLGEFLECKNISIKEFAERIGTTSKNLIDIINGDITLSQNIIYNISFVTSIPVSYIENVERTFKMDKEIKEFLDKNDMTIRQLINKFKYKELSEEYDVQYTDIMDDYYIAKDILRYLRYSDFDSVYKDDNSILYKSKNDKKELLALWLERCYRVVSNQEVKEYNKDNIEVVVNYIREQASKNIFDKEELIRVFNDNGIFLAIEKDLTGSKIRGAFKVLNNKPAIYITKKHKRYADIYFALLHELAHCKSDFNRAKSGSIVTTEDKSVEDYEIKADKTAFNWMIDDKVYQSIKYCSDVIEELDVIKSFYVYRLANDKLIDYSSKMYQEYNKLIEE